MNSVEAASLFAVLQGAYPYAKVDDATVAVWVNSFDQTDYRTAMQAFERWKAEENYFPTVADFNGVVSRILRERRDDPHRPVAAPPSNIRCDGSGWFDRGVGKEPCPTCNPWVRDRWDRGVFEQHMKPPRDYVMPPACRQSHAGDSSFPATKQRAMQLVMLGLREQLAENGLSPEEIDENVKRRLSAGTLMTIGAVLDSPPDTD